MKSTVRIASLVAVIPVFTLLSACGGGGGGPIAGVSTGGTGSLSSGSITGLGSIIVNGVRYNEVDAEVIDLDGNEARSKLSLGANVLVEGGSLTAVTGKNYLYDSTATRIIVSESFKGPIEAIDGSLISLFGAQIECLASTIVEKNSVTASCADLAVSDHVEVYSTYEAGTNNWKASRIEVDDPDGAYKSQGIVTDLISGTSMRLNEVTFDISALEAASLSSGDEVHVIFASARNNANNWVAGRIVPVSTTMKVTSLWGDFDFDDRDAELEGIVRNLSGTSFDLNGISVDASAVSLAGILNGSYIEVKGQFVGNSLVAERIDQEDFEIKRSKFELHGQISGLTPNEVASRSGDFVVRGVTVVFNASTILPIGLVDGQYIEVEGNLSNGIFTATEVEADEIEEDSHSDDRGLDDGDDDRNENESESEDEHDDDAEDDSDGDDDD